MGFKNLLRAVQANGDGPGDDLRNKVVMAIQPVLGGGSMRRSARGNTSDDEKDAGMLSCEVGQHRRVHRLLSMSQVIGEIVVNPRE